MIYTGEKKCPKCGGALKHYGRTNRILRGIYGESHWIKISRFYCVECRSIHRELPKYMYPYKHYDARIIEGVIKGTITYETLGYEDYPCEMTMTRWSLQKERLLKEP